MKAKLEELVDQMIAKGINYSEARREFDRVFLTRALQDSRGNVCKASERIGIHRNTLSRKIDALHLHKKKSA
ncbi:MAG: histidine kinase [Acidobacteriota bacterium]|nr:histidine kinase [Acidobacteriota bacterium]